MKGENYFQTSLDSLSDKRPELAMQLSAVTPGIFQSCQTQKGEENLSFEKNGQTLFLHDNQGAKEEAENWWISLGGERYKLAVIFGPGMGHSYNAAKTWLHEDRSRRLIFLEDQIEVLFCLFHTSVGEEMATDPQVTFEFTPDPIEAVKQIESLFWSCLDLEVGTVFEKFGALPSYQKERSIQTKHFLGATQGAKELLLRHKEFLSPHNPSIANQLSNICQFPKSFLGSNLRRCFKDVPVILCGAGPSIEYHLDYLKTLKDRALIIAAGSAASILTHHGLRPHICLGIDPNPIFYARLLAQEGFEIPLFYGRRLVKEAAWFLQSPLVFCPRKKDEYLDWLEKELKVDGEGIHFGVSVGNFAVSVARLLGCNPLILIGMDMAITQERSYATGLKEHPLIVSKKTVAPFPQKQYVLKTDRGETVKTTVQFLEEAKWLERYIREHPESKVINANEEGLDIRGAEKLTLRQAIEKYASMPSDLNGKLHAELMRAGTMNISREDVQKVFQDWGEEAVKGATFCAQALELISKEDRQALKDLEEKNKNTPVYQWFLKPYNHCYQKHDFDDLRIWGMGKDSDLRWKEKQTERYTLLLRDLGGLTEASHVCSTQLEKASISPAEIESENVEKFTLRYEFEKEQFVIEDPELEISFSEKWTPKGKEKVVEYFENKAIKSECTYKKGQLHGPSIYYHPEGRVLSKSWFVQGKRIGRTHLYYASGALFSIQRWKEGVMHGKQEWFGEEGRLQTFLPFQQGRLDGKVQLFYPNGHLKREIEFSGGKREGTEQMWTESGQLMMLASYTYDAPFGKVSSWYQSGQRELEIFYDSPGKITTLYEWDEKGNRIQAKGVRKEMDAQLSQIGEVFEKTEQLRKEVGENLKKLGKVGHSKDQELKKELDKAAKILSTLKKSLPEHDE